MGLVLQFKLQLPQATSSLMEVYMTNNTDHALHNCKTNKCSKPGIFHESFCKTGIDPEGLTRVTPKPNPLVLTAK